MRRRHPLALPKNPHETLLQAGRRRCLNCSGAYYDPIRDKYHRNEECVAHSCPYWPYAMGVNKWLDEKKWGAELKEWEERQRQLWG